MDTTTTCRAATDKGTACVRAGNTHVLVRACTYTMYHHETPVPHAGTWDIHHAYVCAQHANMLATGKALRTLTPYTTPITNTKENSTMDTNDDIDQVCDKFKPFVMDGIMYMDDDCVTCGFGPDAHPYDPDVDTDPMHMEDYHNGDGHAPEHIVVQEDDLASFIEQFGTEFPVYVQMENGDMFSYSEYVVWKKALKGEDFGTPKGKGVLCGKCRKNKVQNPYHEDAPAVKACYMKK